MVGRRRPQAAEDGEWHRVDRSRSYQDKEDQFFRQKRAEQVTKFFVANLPENCSKLDLSKSFGEYGAVKNVYIARKRNQMGHLFGFVSFVNVFDGLELQRKLNRLALGKNKLKVNIATFAEENFDNRFTRVQNNVEGERKSGPRNFYSTGKDPVSSSHAHYTSRPKAGGVSYLEKLMNKEKEDQSAVGLKEIKVNENVLAFKEFFGKALVGRVVDFTTLRRLKGLIADSNWSGFEVVYLGGMYSLVSFDDSETANSFLKSDSWKSWFSELETWQGKTNPFERIAWLNVTGVPLCLAEKSVFENIGRKLGKVIHLADLHFDDGDLSQVCMGVLVESGEEINEEIKLGWKNSRFSVWIKEGVGSWFPEGVGRVNRKNSEEEFNSGGASESMGESFSPVMETEKSEDEQSGTHGNMSLGSNNSTNVSGEFLVGVNAHNPRGGVLLLKKKKSKGKWVRRGPGKRDEPVGVGSILSANSVESNRPNKRPRSNDPFGLDEIISNLVWPARPPQSVNSEVDHGKNGATLAVSLDLNKSLGGSVRVAPSMDQEPSVGDGLEKNDKVIDLDNELSETVKMGSKQGVNLDNYGKEIKEVLAEEGFECEVEEAILEEGGPDDPTRVTPIPFELDGENNVDIGLSHVHLYQQKIQEEVDATLNIASLIGVDLSGFVGLVEKHVMEDGV